MSVFDSVAGKVGAVLGGGGSNIGSFIGTGAAVIGTGLVKGAVGAKYMPVVDAALNTIGDLASGNFRSAALTAINSGLFTSKLPWLDGAAAGLYFHSMPSRATGGVAPMDAKKVYQETIETHFGHKNLFIVDIVSQFYPWDAEEGMESLRLFREAGLHAPAESASYAKFNMFVLDASYGPKTIAAESHRVGSAVLDQPNGSEAVSLRLTTLDDERGSVKKWFKRLCDTVARKDGTFGTPAEYLVQIRVTHSFTTDDASGYWLGRDGQAGAKGAKAWSSETWYRPVSIELDLSRRDESLEEVTLVFAEYDTYF